MGNVPSHGEWRHTHRRSPEISQFRRPTAVAPIVTRLRALPGHVFWKDGLSLVDSDLVDVDQIATPGQVTDTYLLALAIANKGQLATFDRRLSTKAVRRGRAGLHVIDGGG
jgi:predicted nucleic acid-binding protein